MIGQGRLVRLPLDPRLADVPWQKLINHQVRQASMRTNAYCIFAEDAGIYEGHHNTGLGL